MERRRKEKGEKQWQCPTPSFFSRTRNERCVRTQAAQQKKKVGVYSPSGPSLFLLWPRYSMNGGIADPTATTSEKEVGREREREREIGGQVQEKALTDRHTAHTDGGYKNGALTPTLFVGDSQQHRISAVYLFMRCFRLLTASQRNYNHMLYIYIHTHMCF